MCSNIDDICKASLKLTLHRKILRTWFIFFRLMDLNFVFVYLYSTNCYMIQIAWHSMALFLHCADKDYFFIQKNCGIIFLFIDRNSCTPWTHEELNIISTILNSDMFPLNFKTFSFLLNNGRLSSQLLETKRITLEPQLWTCVPSKWRESTLSIRGI